MKLIRLKKRMPTMKVSLWNPKIMNRPVSHFAGDSDGDGVFNMFDCQPNNRRKQGPFHEGMDPLPEMGKRVPQRERVTSADRERLREGVERLNKAAEKSSNRRSREDED